MKMMKKVISAIAVTAMVAVTAIPVTSIKVHAAPAPIVTYDFNNGTGMSSSGIAGSTEPTVVDDAERGKVLKLAEGTSAKYLTGAQDPSLGQYNARIEKGTPSSLTFPNPFAGKSGLSGVTMSFWIKVPDGSAATNAAGILGFVSPDKTVVHPDNAAFGKTEPDATGPYAFGITCAFASPVAVKQNPMLYFAGLHHNSYTQMDPSGIFSRDTNTWKYVTVTMNNSEGAVYVNGQKATLGTPAKSKRWNGGESVGGTQGNTDQIKFLDYIAAGDTQAYVGYTGFSPTTEMYLDDISFFASELSAADIASLYETAKSGGGASGGTNNNASSGTTNNNNNSSNDDAAARKAAAEKAAAEAAAREAAAIEENKRLTDAALASVEVKGMGSATLSKTGIYRGTGEYTSMQSALNGVILRDGYRLSNFVAMDLNFGGTQPEAVAKVVVDVPSGFDTNNLVVTRINDDGTVSVLKHTIENGKIVAKTNHFSKYAIVNLEVGTPGSASANLPKTGAVAGGVVAGVGVVSVFAGILLIKRRKVEFE